MRRDSKKRAAWIYWKLRLAGTSGAEVGRKLGVSTALVSRTIRGEWRNPRVRRAVAAALGLSFAKVWGEEEDAPEKAEPGSSPEAANG